MIITLKSRNIEIPTSILKMVHFNDNDTLNIKAENDTIILEKVENKYKNIKELFKNYDAEYSTDSYDWGEPVGGEIW